MRRMTSALALAALALALAASGSASAVATMPVPVTGYITTYTGGPMAASGTYCPQATGACAVVVLHPETGATFRWQLAYPDGHVASGSTTSGVLRFAPLASGVTYAVREYAARTGYISSGWSAWAAIATRTCASSAVPGFGPEADMVARTTVLDGTSWLGWVNRHTPGEFSNSLGYSLDCEADDSLVSNWYVVQYVNGEKFTAPLNKYTGLWHLAAP